MSVIATRQRLAATILAVSGLAATVGLADAGTASARRAPDPGPEIVSLTSSPASVDVTGAARSVTVRLHVRDDAGVRRPASASGGVWRLAAGDRAGDPTLALSRFRLASGDRRDGVWAAKVVVPRGFPAGDLHAVGDVCDVALACAHDDDAFLQVTDTAPDLARPTVSLLEPLRHRVVSVRHGRQTLQVRARVRDADTGTAGVRVCLTEPSSDPEPEIVWFPRHCRAAHLRSGDRHRGVWQGVVSVPRSEHSRDACIWIGAADRAQPLLRARYSCAASREDRPFPGRRGYVEIVGHGSAKAPRLASYQQSPSSVTATDPGVVISFRATDDSGVEASVVDLWSATTGLRLHQFIEMTAGSERDGTWTGTVDVGALPPGTYYPVVTVADGTHVRSYAGASIARHLDLRTRPLPGGSHPVTAAP